MTRPVIKIVFALFTFTSTFPISTCILEDEILEFLEELRVRMCHPIPNLGVPALDPLKVSHRALHLDNKYLLDFNSSIDNFQLTGISDFTVNTLKLHGLPGLRSIIDINLPLAALKSMYTAKGSVGNILNLVGEGMAEASISEIHFSISWILKAGSKLAIRGLRLEVNIKKVWIDFEHLIEEPRVNDFVHALVNELGVELLNDIWEDENELAHQLAETKINDYIGQYTLKDIISIIGNIVGGGSPIFEDVPADCKYKLQKKD